MCQYCQMPLSEGHFVCREMDGAFNKDYQKWYYSNGKFVHQTKEELLDYLVSHMPDAEDICNSTPAFPGLDIGDDLDVFAGCDIERRK